MQNLKVKEIIEYEIHLQKSTELEDSTCFTLLLAYEYQANKTAI